MVGHRAGIADGLAGRPGEWLRVGHHGRGQHWRVAVVSRLVLTAPNLVHRILCCTDGNGSGRAGSRRVMVGVTMFHGRALIGCVLLTAASSAVGGAGASGGTGALWQTGRL